MPFFRVGPSQIQGFGLFAVEDIPKGTVWWQGSPDNLITVERQSYETLLASNHSKNLLLSELQTYAYYVRELDKLFYICDDGRYLNHSITPNSAPTRDLLGSVAIRDIRQGEELTEDYRTYDPCPWANLWGELGKQLGMWHEKSPPMSLSR